VNEVGTLQPRSRPNFIAGFHTFDDDHERPRFARNAAAVLANRGIGLSLIGSTQGARRSSARRDEGRVSR
jgi:hypothetical protein